MKVPISKRLLSCTECIPNGAKIADIGCDHGYLSIYLLLEKHAVFVHACDLRTKPLQKAMENAEVFQVREKMRFSCADGLQAVEPSSIDTVVCAGMGADTIISILSQADWVKDPRILLILQPQSSGQDLRRYLAQQGFALEHETLVEDGGFIYTVMAARYDQIHELTPGEQYVSPQLLQSGNPLLSKYLDRIEHALENTVEGIQKARREGMEERLSYYEAALAQVRQMRKDSML